MNASVWVTLVVVLMVYSGLTLALTRATTRNALVAIPHAWLTSEPVTLASWM